MARVPAEAAEVGLAAVADGDLGQQGVERGVESGRDEEARVVRRERREGAAEDDDAEARLLVEVPLHVELLAGAGRATVHDAFVAQRRRERRAACRRRTSSSGRGRPGRTWPPRRSEDKGRRSRVRGSSTSGAGAERPARVTLRHAPKTTTMYEALARVRATVEAWCRERSRAARALLAALGLAVVLVGGEHALEQHYYGRTYRFYEVGEVYWEDSSTLLLFSPDRYLFWRLKASIVMTLEESPEQSGLFLPGPRPAPYTFTIRTNRRGYNSPEFECANADGFRRIVALGDSRTMAEGVKYEEAYPRRLEALLRAGRGPHSEVVNAGIAGYSSFQGLRLLEREILGCRPDVVTVLFGINDQHSFQGVRDVEKARIFDSPLVSARQALNQSMLWYFTQRQALRARAALFGGTPIGPVRLRDGTPQEVPRVSLEEYEQNLDRFVDLSEEHGFAIVLVIVPPCVYAYDPTLFRDRPAAPPQSILDVLTAAGARMDEGCQPDLIASLERIVGENPRLPEARHVLARCYQRAARFDDAQREFLAQLGRADRLRPLRGDRAPRGSASGRHAGGPDAPVHVGTARAPVLRRDPPERARSRHHRPGARPCP